mgnify:CR=1 FL=1
MTPDYLYRFLSDTTTYTTFICGLITLIATYHAAQTDLTRLQKITYGVLITVTATLFVLGLGQLLDSYPIIVQFKN